MTSDAQLSVRCGLADFERERVDPSLVVEAVTIISTPASILTCSEAAPLAIATTLPLKTLRAESFVD